MFAQYAPGKPRPGPDSTDARTAAFLSCLDHIATIPHIVSVAFPFQIGSGLAGGDWDNYRGMIDRFAAENPLIRVAIYTLPGTTGAPAPKRSRGGGGGGRRGSGTAGRGGRGGGRGKSNTLGDSVGPSARITDFFGGPAMKKPR